MILSADRFNEISGIIEAYEDRHHVGLVRAVMLSEALEAINGDGTLGDVSRIDVPKVHVQKIVSLIAETGLTRDELVNWACDDHVLNY